MDRFFKLKKFPGLPGSFNLSILMSLQGIVLFCIFPCNHRLFAMIAMLLSTVGDILLMNFHHLFDRIPYFGIGACFFMAAHFFYAGAYGTLLRTRELPANANAGTLTAGIILCGIAAMLIILGIKTKHVGTKMIPLMVVYVCFIGINFLIIATYAFACNRWFSYLAFVGAASFLASDTFIAMDIVGGVKCLRPLVWTFYPIGQIILIACA